MAEIPPSRSTVVPGMSYLRAPEAIDWLCDVLGFERQAIFPGPGNTILHAQLTHGSGMIMLGSVNDNEYRRFIRQPADTGGAETRSVSITVPDADVVYARVLGSGAEVLFPIEDKPYGGRGFTCRDPEGHIWDVGTYDPWKTTA